MRYRFDQFVLDVQTATLTRQGQVINLRRRAFDLLKVLVEQAPALVTRDQILDAVWGHDALSPNVLPQAIGEVRQALGDSAQSPRLIETQHRRGYRLLVPVQVEAAEASARDAMLAAGAEPTAAGVPDTREDAAPLPTRRGWLMAVLVVLVTMVAGLLWQSGPRPGAPAGSASRPALALMLDSDSAAPPWLAGAGTELLSVALAGDDRLRLLRSDGRAAVRANADNRWQTWLRDALGAELALTGLWRLAEGEPALSWSLVRLEDGSVLLGGQTGDRDLAALGQRVAREVRDHLRILQAGSGPLTGLPAAAAAREAYYQGLAALAQGRAGDAVSALEQAVVDPAAGARVQLALASAWRLDGHLGKARQVFERILADEHGFSAGERLRLEAEAALVDHRPADAAASLRALHRLLPEDAEIALALADAQLQARQTRAAAATLRGLETLSGDDNPDPRWHLAQASLAQLEHRGGDARAAAERALALAEQFQIPAQAVRAHLELAQIARQQGQPRAAADRLQALLAQPLSDSQRAEVLTLHGSQLRDLGDFDQADVQLAQAGERFAALGDHAGVLRVRIEQHTIDSERGHSEQALIALQQLQDEVVALDDALLLARYYNTLGVQAIRNQKIEPAERWLREAASQARRAGQPDQEAGAYNNLGMALARNGRLDDAGVTWEQALQVFSDSGDRMGQAITLGNLANVASGQGKLGRSRDLNQQALAIFRELQAGQHLARTAFNLGLATEREGRLVEAEALFQEAFDSYRSGGAGDPVLNVAAVLVRVQSARGRVAQAREVLASVHGKQADSSNPVARSHVLTAAGNLALLTGDGGQARQMFEQARQLREQADQGSWVSFSDLDLAGLALREGQAPERVQAQAERLYHRLLAERDGRGQIRALLLQVRAQLLRGQFVQAAPLIEQARSLLAANPGAEAALELRRLAILSEQDGAGLARQARLTELAAEAERDGFVSLAWRCRLDAEPDDPALVAQVRSLELAGLLQR